MSDAAKSCCVCLENFSDDDCDAVECRLCKLIVCKYCFIDDEDDVWCSCDGDAARNDGTRFRPGKIVIHATFLSNAKEEEQEQEQAQQEEEEEEEQQKHEQQEQQEEKIGNDDDNGHGEMMRAKALETLQRTLKRRRTGWSTVCSPSTPRNPFS
jgi:hypothetical protein